MVSFSTFILEQFVWADRFKWTGVVQNTERALNGALHVEPTTVAVGRPITLLSKMESFSVFNDLMVHAQSTTNAFVLTINGVAYNVIWFHDPVAITGEPLNDFSDADPEQFQNVQLNFITV